MKALLRDRWVGWLAAGSVLWMACWGLSLTVKNVAKGGVVTSSGGSMKEPNRRYFKAEMQHDEVLAAIHAYEQAGAQGIPDLGQAWDVTPEGFARAGERLQTILTHSLGKLAELQLARDRAAGVPAGGEGE